MGSIATGLVQKIAATSAITALIGDRFYPSTVRIADKTYPLIAYKVDNVTGTNTYDGTVNNLRSCNVVMACVAETYGAADELCTAILTAFDGTSGTWGDTTVQGCFLQEDGIADDVMTEPETEEILFHIKEVTFLVWYETQ